MRFKPGQQVVCIEESGWFVYWTENGKPDSSSTGPAKDEIVTVFEYFENSPYVSFVEYRYDSLDGEPQYFHEENFSPLMDITELTEILESVPESV